MRSIKKIFAALLVLCMLVVSMQGFTSKAAEATEGSWAVFEVEVFPKTELVAGEQFLLEVNIRNTSDMEFASLRFINVWYHADESAPGTLLGVLEDANNKGTEIEQQKPLDITFSKGESKQFELGGTLPRTWNQNSSIAIVVSGQVDNVNYYGQGGVPEGAVLSSVSAFEVAIDGPEKVVADEEIILDVKVKNKSKYKVTASEFDAFYCGDIDNRDKVEDEYLSGEKLFGTIYDSTGELALENTKNLIYEPGETKSFQIKGTLPQSWDADHGIYVKMQSDVGKKTYHSSSEIFQVVCEKQEPEVKVEGNLEADVKVEGDTNLPGKTIFVADDITTSIENTVKTKVEEVVVQASKEIKAITTEHKVAAILDLKLVLREGNQEIEFEPNGSLQVTVQIPDNVVKDYENVILLHIKDDGTVEEVPFTRETGNKATFTTDSFSYYVFVGTEKVLAENNTSTNTATSVTQAVPETGDSTQILTWSVIMAIACVGIIAVSVNKKRSYR